VYRPTPRGSVLGVVFANGVKVVMQTESRRIGARSKQDLLWAAGHIIAEQSKGQVNTALAKVFAAYGDSLKPTDVRGALALQTTYDQIARRARDITRTLAGGLNVDDPAIIRMLTNVHSLSEPPAAPDEDSEPPSSPTDSAEAFLAEVFAATATSPGVSVTSTDDGFFDDLPSADSQPDAPEPELKGRAALQLAAMTAYGKYLVRHAKIPLVPYTRPDLGVTFFPTGRFDDEDGVDWNYNGQVGGEMIRDCGEDKLLFLQDQPVKSILEFQSWSFTRTQKVSGTIWVWAVHHEDGKQMRFWFNDGEDRARFYYTMTPTGVTQVQKKPKTPGSKKFVKVAEKHITPLDLDS
jgi:hypothetical protein